MSESFAELFEESIQQNNFKPGELITGEIVSITDDVVIVHAGLKSEGIIPISEFRDHEGNISVNVGDDIEVVLESLENGFGETQLSREKAMRVKAWGTLEVAFEEQSIVKGVMTGKVKGGFTISIETIRAFLPASLVDVRPVRDPSYLEGKELEFKVIKIDRKRNNVVVSRRAVVETELSAEREELLENLEEGMTVKGIVKNLTDYGAFIDLGGVDGLLHITDLAWKRVKHPSEVLNIGDEIEAKVLRYDRERNRVSLGLKQLGDDPWVDIVRRYPEGKRLFGK
ncbi:MAG: S1 RNA-binding domain-containing protein, partial [Acidiferrobacterales bacterium]